MRKNKYIMPSIEIAEIDAEDFLLGSNTLGGGGNDGGSATTESKRNVIFASFDSYDSDDDWGDIWADETEEY